jgi:hypothetical protein
MVFTNGTTWIHAKYERFQVYKHDIHNIMHLFPAIVANTVKFRIDQLSIGIWDFFSNLYT